MIGQASGSGALATPSGAVTPAAPEPDFDRHVHVSQWGTRTASGGPLPLIVQGCIGLTAAALMVAYQLMWSLGVPGPVVHGLIVGFALLAIGWGLRWVALWYKRNHKAMGGPGFKPDERYRVRLIGPTDKTAAAIPQDASSFEPHIQFAWLGLPPSRAGVYVWVAVSVVVALVWIGLEQVRPLGLPGIGYLEVMAWIGVGGIAASLATPTYFRVVPGRIDVMRFNFFRSRQPSLQSYDLRRGRVLVDLRYRFIVVEPPEAAELGAFIEIVDAFGRKLRKPRPGTLEIVLLALPRSRELARAVLAGAVSTAPTPPLPEDELVG